MGALVTAGVVSIPMALAVADPTGAARAALREDDRQVIAACQQGEREAFDRLVERYQRDVYRLCYRYVNSHQDANDMAQDVFLKAYRAIGRFRGDSSFSTWLYRIAVNTCLNFKAARRLPQDELSDQIADRGASAAERMHQAERSAEVRRAVSRLPEKQRATLILKIYQDLTHEEVAGILGSSVGTVKANLFHALANLKKLMTADA